MSPQLVVSYFYGNWCVGVVSYSCRVSVSVLLRLKILVTFFGSVIFLIQFGVSFWRSLMWVWLDVEAVERWLKSSCSIILLMRKEGSVASWGCVLLFRAFDEKETIGFLGLRVRYLRVRFGLVFGSVCLCGCTWLSLFTWSYFIRLDSLEGCFVLVCPRSASSLS